MVVICSLVLKNTFLIDMWPCQNNGVFYNTVHVYTDFKLTNKLSM